MIAFTICSNNYLAKAKVVGDSFIFHNPDYHFIVFLVDKLSHSINYDSFLPHEIIEVHTVVFEINDLALKYNIIELSTAIKPAIFQYLFNQYNIIHVLYLDPDLMIFNRFTELESVLKQPYINIIITPHFCSPVDDGKYPSEIDFTVYGLYNLGFIAIKNTLASNEFLAWWNSRLMKYSFIRPEKGMFTDQIWVNYAPIFFDGVHIIKHLGYNVANWNLYERNLSLQKETYYINERFSLKFFHFSHFDTENPYIISKSQTRHVIKELPIVKQILDEYKLKLIENNYLLYSSIMCYYQQLFLSNLQEQENLKQLEHLTFQRRIKRRIIYYLNLILGN